MVKESAIYKILALGILLALKPGCSDTHFEGAGKLLTRTAASPAAALSLRHIVTY